MGKSLWSFELDVRANDHDGQWRSGYQLFTPNGKLDTRVDCGVFVGESEAWSRADQMAKEDVAEKMVITPPRKLLGR
ncbi:hypothetical protein D7I39_11125 [Allopusillimonas ginsengisoli]|nr:hypothetical protein D7I39_11125 [Allopusillimonas ginsengisoli]